MHANEASGAVKNMYIKPINRKIKLALLNNNTLKSFFINLELYSK